MTITLNPRTGRYESSYATQAVSSASALELKRKQRLEQYGYDSEIKPKVSFVEKFLDILPRTEAASASLIGGLGMGQDLQTSLTRAKEALQGKRKYTYTDILKEMGAGDTLGTKVLGFALGTALDPLTYLPIGGILGKGGKVAKKVLGIKELTPAMKELSTLLKGVSGGTNFLAEANFKRFEPLFATMRGMSDDSLKLVGRAIEKPNIYLKKLDDAGLALHGELTSMFKETGKQKQAFGIVKELIGGEKSKQLILKGMPTKKVFGLSGAEADAYLPHIITDEFRQKLLDMGKTPEEVINTLRGLTRTNLPKVEKTRTLLGTIADLNRQSMKKYGVKIFESDLKKVVPKYLYSYSRNMALTDLNKELLKITDEAGRPLIKAIKNGKTSAGMVKLTGLPYEMGYQASPEVAKQINRVMGVFGSDPLLNKYLKGFDKLQSFWKKGVTVYNPTFHLTNLMGATFNNFIKDTGSLSPDVIAKALAFNAPKPKFSEIIAKNGKKIGGKEFLEYLRKHGALTSFVSPEKVAVPEKGIVGAINKLTGGAGQGVENLARTQLALSTYKKTGSLSDAVRAVWEVHGNYSPEAMSSLERNAVKRIFPFYNWAKTNIPFQLKSLITKTPKYAALARAQNEAVSPEERATLPEWMRALPLLPTKTKEGVKSTYSLNLPIGDLNEFALGHGLGGNIAETLRKLAGSRLSPAAKAPIGMMANKNLFYNRPIVDQELPTNMQKAPAYEVMKYLPQGLKDLTGYQEYDKASEATGQVKTKREMNAWLKYVIDTFGGQVSRYGNLPKRTEEERATQGLGQTGMDNLVSIMAAILNPAKPQTVNIQEQALSEQKAREADLQNRINYLIYRGLIPKMK